MQIERRSTYSDKQIGLLLKCIDQMEVTHVQWDNEAELLFYICVCFNVFVTGIYLFLMLSFTK